MLPPAVMKIMYYSSPYLKMTAPEMTLLFSQPFDDQDLGFVL